MSLFSLAFSSPLVLLALAGAPLLYLLLRVTPPPPRRIAFPPLKLILDLKKPDATPARTPLWLLILRMALAALVVLAMAGPMLSPSGAPARKAGRCCCWSMTPGRRRPTGPCGSRPRSAARSRRPRRPPGGGSGLFRAVGRRLDGAGLRRRPEPLARHKTQGFFAGPRPGVRRDFGLRQGASLGAGRLADRRVGRHGRRRFRRKAGGAGARRRNFTRFTRRSGHSRRRQWRRRARGPSGPLGGAWSFQWAGAGL